MRILLFAVVFTGLLFGCSEKKKKQQETTQSLEEISSVLALIDSCMAATNSLEAELLSSVEHVVVKDEDLVGASEAKINFAPNFKKNIGLLKTNFTEFVDHLQENKIDLDRLMEAGKNYLEDNPLNKSPEELEADYLNTNGVSQGLEVLRKDLPVTMREFEVKQRELVENILKYFEEFHKTK